MYENIYNFLLNWLGETNNLVIPIPFTNGASMDIVSLMSFALLGFCICWILYFICKIINTFFKIF